MQGQVVSSSWLSVLGCIFTILLDQMQPVTSSQERNYFNTLIPAKPAIGPSQVELSGLLSRSMGIIGSSGPAVHCNNPKCLTGENDGGPFRCWFCFP